MKLAVINGSPRGKKSNSDRIIGWMTEGMQDVGKFYAANVKTQRESAKNAAQADCVLIVFPLYTDMMPGLMKALFEELGAEDLRGKSIAFVVHSGFPEAVHSRTIEKYLRYFAKLNDMNFLGVAVMGGSEALQVAPDNYFGKRVGAFKQLGKNILRCEALDEKALKTIARKEQYSRIALFIMRFLPTDMYWNSQLKKNGVYENRFAKPYEK